MEDASALKARLSDVLRKATAAIHRETESALNLPQSIRTAADYRDLLRRFYRLYAPLEHRLGGFTQWPEIGMIVPVRTQSEWLARDLRALGVEPETLPWAAGDRLPNLDSFAHALGAMYVMQGSTLGSQVILRQLREVLGPAMSRADNFLRGHGSSTRHRWMEYCVALDRYGEQPSAKPDQVIDGALSTFAAVGSCMKAGMKAEMTAAYAEARSDLPV